MNSMCTALRNAGIIVCLGLLASCGDRGDDELLTSPVSQSGGPGVAPAYLSTGKHRLGDVLHAQVVSTSNELLCVVSGPLPTSTEATVVLTHDIVQPQDVVTGVDSAGAAFVILVGFDLIAGSSKIQSFLDINGDGLPDQSSKVTIATTSGAHYTSCELDPAGVLYVGDPLQNAIWRVIDGNADLMPDALAVQAFAQGGSGGVLPAGFQLHRTFWNDITSNLIALESKFDAEWGFDYLEMVDSNGDGIADSAASRSANSHEPDGDFGDFIDAVHDGDTAVVVVAPLGRSCRIEAVDGATIDTLATFDGHLSSTSVTLSRSVVSGEFIRVYDVDQSLAYDLTEVRASGDPSYDKLNMAGSTTKEGASIGILGRGFAGTEAVEVRVAGGATWVPCTITQWAAAELTVTIPDVVAALPQPCEIRVTPLVGEVGHFRVTVAP
jgi:hypothetical protein